MSDEEAFKQSVECITGVVSRVISTKVGGARPRWRVGGEEKLYIKSLYSSPEQVFIP